MSISAARSAASRENGAQSHGPVTDEGKARSAQNARKHGLFGAIALQTPEDQQAYNELLEAYFEEFQPASIFEARCVREMVDAEWRLASLRNMMGLLEATTAEDRAAAFERMAGSGQALSLALRYEKHFQRQFEKAHKDLLDSRRRNALDRDQIAQRTDMAMVNMIKSVIEAPLPPLFKNLQNEPKHPPTQPNNTPFNPALRV